MKGVILVLAAAGVAASIPLLVPSASDAQESAAVAPAADPDLAAVRAAAERFRDVEVALAEGYIRDPMDHCAQADEMGLPAELGAMGIHYFRPDLLGITSGPEDPRVDGTGTHTDFLQPSILLYEPQADGSLELIGVENLTFMEAWHRAGNVLPPSFEGYAYNLMADDPTTELDEAHMFTPHYDRHVWLFRENPRGVFAQWNPNVTCENHHGSHAH